MKNNLMKNEELRIKNVFYSAHEISYFHSSFFIFHSERSDHSSFYILHSSF